MGEVITLALIIGSFFCMGLVIGYHVGFKDAIQVSI